MSRRVFAMIMMGAFGFEISLGVMAGRPANLIILALMRA